MPTNTSNQEQTQQEKMAAYAYGVCGMRAWIADAYAKIATAAPKKSGSATAVVKACQTLLQNDTGAVDPLVCVLAKEILRLNGEPMRTKPTKESPPRDDAPSGP